jgi:hypothetical protein
MPTKLKMGKEKAEKLKSLVDCSLPVGELSKGLKLL